MSRNLKAAELFLSLGLAASMFTACTTTPEGNGEAAGGDAPMTEVEGGEGGEGGPGAAANESLQWANTFDDDAVISEFTSKVVIPQYEQFALRTAALNQAIEAFVASPTEASLAAARQAWTATRISWEQTETFAFGPAGSLGFDGAMDSWPVNQTDIEQVLAGSEPITAESVAQLQDTERGMHSIEYILFGTDASKAVSDFSDREQAYLSALGEDLNTSADALLASWTAGIEGQPAYETVFASAGSADNEVYPTIAAAGQELVSGIIDSLTEVGEEKLAAPFTAQDTEGLESRFSAQTINDLKSNLQSAENGYFGQFPEAGTKTDASISTYVAARDPALDKKVTDQFAAANSALNAVPTPLEKSLTDEAAADEIEQAIAAILEVKSTLETEVVPLI
ncbi:MAG: imelysin family protein [Phormidesmis sp.]